YILRERVKRTAHPRTTRNPSGEEALCVLEDLKSGPGHLPLCPESGLVEIGCMPVEGVRKFVDAATFRRGGPDHRRNPAVSGRELELQIRDEHVFAPEVRLVHDIHVADLEDPGLHCLDG